MEVAVVGAKPWEEEVKVVVESGRVAGESGRVAVENEGVAEEIDGSHLSHWPPRRSQEERETRPKLNCSSSSLLALDSWRWIL